MRKGLFLLVLSALAALLAGCSTPAPAPAPEPEPAVSVTMQRVEDSVVQSSLSTEMQTLADQITQAGGLAALGTDESRSLDLALNMAKKNGRIELARILNTHIEALAKAFSEETGIPYDSLLLTGFNNAARIITKQQIAGSIAKELKYEQTGDTFTAYAIMVLDPKVIVDQLAKEPDLYPRLQPSKAFDVLNQEAIAYKAFTQP
jgi:PBP1b-binding outer membrane lipoprotein LpoB